MSWDAKGFDKPLILLEYDYTAATIEKNAYKLTDEVKGFNEGNPSSEEFLHRLRTAEKLKPVCDYLAHALNRRAGVWWASLCVLSLKKEKKEAAEKGIDREKQKEEEKKKLFEPATAAATERAASKEKNQQFKAKMNQLEEEVKNQSTEQGKRLAQRFASPGDNPVYQSFLEEHAKVMASLKPEDKLQVSAIVEQTKANFAEKYGKTIPQAVKDIVQGNMTPPAGIADKSGYAKAQKAKMDEQMKALRAMIDKKMSIFPLKIPGIPAKASTERIDEAYDSAVRWVAAPTQVNALLACEAAKNSSRTPEGMLAFSAFWSGNNLSSRKDILVPPPPGLGAKGVSGTLFICAMAKDGTKSFDERYQEYYDLGVEVAQGINVWDDKILKEFSDESDNDWEGKSGFGRKP